VLPVDKQPKNLTSHFWGIYEMGFPEGSNMKFHLASSNKGKVGGIFKYLYFELSLRIR
jgi:hypothetical protein